MLIVGIDPGKSGGVGWLCTITNEYGAVPMPGTAKQVYTLLAELKERYGTMTAVLEEPQAMGIKISTTSAMAFGKGYGELVGLLTALGASMLEVRPAKWKKDLKLTKDKNDSILLCERLYPAIDLFPGRVKKGLDGVAEGMLLAHWGKSHA